MTLTIRLSTDAEARLLRLATAAGWSPADYVARLVERAVVTPGVDDALAPFRQQVAQSGMDDAQLDAFFEGLRDEVWHERASGNGGGEGGPGRRAA